MVLEASVAELHQMFLDFALLTEEQGELLDQIEYQVKSGLCREEELYPSCCRGSGLAEIINRVRIRRIQCCIIITCLVIIGIIVAIVIGTQTAQGKLAIASVKGRRV